ncbi:MAG TPA: NAD(P)H-dependent oxidoreductase [Sinomonas sp.]|nr:NAD(P)H-dependent oxidoreductase [Sinomonas sp.]
METVVVVGNPKTRSRTRDAGLRLAALLGAAEPGIVEVADLGPGLLSWGDEAVATAVQKVSQADLAIFCSPTFKATYSGLLKLFLDQFSTGTGLMGVTAIPLMMGAGPAHALAPDLLLKPVLVELGATTPAPGLYQIDATYGVDGTGQDYAQRWSPVIAATISAAGSGKTAAPAR